MKIRKLEKGELIAILAFALLSVILFILALQVFLKDPTLSSAGAFPFLMTTLMLIMSGLMLFELRKYASAYEEKTNVLEKFKESSIYIFPDKIFFILIFIVVYAIALPKVGFIISTALYLFISMITLKNKDILKSLVVSIGIVAFILVVFQFIFKVMLP